MIVDYSRTKSVMKLFKLFIFYIERVQISDGDPDPLWKRIFVHISNGLDSILIIIKPFLSVLKISGTFVFFLRTSGEYWKNYRKEYIFNTDSWKRIEYSLKLLKKYFWYWQQNVLWDYYKSSRDMDKDQFSQRIRIHITGKSVYEDWSL